jgi:hypothetical protein
MGENDKKDILLPRRVVEKFGLTRPLIDALKIGREALNNKRNAEQKPPLDAKTFNQFIIMNAIAVFRQGSHIRPESKQDIGVLLTGLQQSVSSGTQKSSDVEMTIGVLLPEAAAMDLRTCQMNNETAMAGGLLLLQRYVDGKPLRLVFDDGGSMEYPFVDA